MWIFSTHSSSGFVSSSHYVSVISYYILKQKSGTALNLFLLWLHMRIPVSDKPKNATGIGKYDVHVNDQLIS